MSIVKKMLVIDTDCGVDDAVALLLALSRPDVTVKAITCCHGNTSLSNVCDNVFRVLQVCGLTHIPVFAGCDRALLGTRHVDAGVHGDDGFGDISNTIPVDSKCKLQETHASQALLQLVNEHPNELTLVALGPLTNLAVAQRLDPNFSSKLRELVYMGGNVEGRGNIVAAAEFNFYCDPESAYVVLNDFTCPMVCIPWETCLISKFPWEVYHQLMAQETPKAIFMRNVTKNIAQMMCERKREGFHCCDLFAMAVAVDETTASEIIYAPTTVELTGTVTRGQMVVDRRINTESKPNVRVVLSLNMKLLLAATEAMLI